MTRPTPVAAWASCYTPHADTIATILDQPTDRSPTVTRPAPRRRGAKPEPTAAAQPSQPADMRQAGPPTQLCARCRAHYLPDPDGRTAHRDVFGHQPTGADQS